MGAPDAPLNWSYFEAIIASDDIWIVSGLCREVLSRLKSEPLDHREGSDL